MICLRLDVQKWGIALEWRGGTSGTGLFLRERVGVYDISDMEQVISHGTRRLAAHAGDLVKS